LDISFKKENNMFYKIFRSFFTLILVIGLMALQAPQPARAAGSLYVTTNGNDTNDCLNPSTSCATIEGAVGKGNAGDTIYIAEGIYLGSLATPLTLTKSTFLSGGWDPTFTNQSGYSTVDGQNLQRLVVVGNGIASSFDHLILQNGGRPYPYSPHQGGGVYVWGRLRISNSIIQNNIANNGGGIYNEGNLTLNNVTIRNNSSGAQTGAGAGIYNRGYLTLNNSTVSGNTAYTGGGIYNLDGNVSLNNSIVSDNTTSVSGSGIRNLNILYLTDTTVANNSATSNGISGAGIINEGTTVMFNSSIVGNSSNNIGAGISNWGIFRIVNSTVSGNSPGGIVNSATLEMYNVTISNNTSHSAGGGLVNFNVTTLQNTIIAGNSGSAGILDCFGTLTSEGYNLIQNTTGCTISGDTTGNILGVDPKLGPLQDNGGPTQTHALLAGSPAIDTGNPTGCKEYHRRVLTSDQRGVSRPQGTACDIGAFEHVPPIVVSIDIKPGSDTNPIKPDSNGKIPVAILSTPDFDAPSMVDVSSLTFGSFGDEESLAFCNEGGEDVNNDGLLDLVCHFETQLTGLTHPKYRYGNLKGSTVDGKPLEGKDAVDILY